MPDTPERRPSDVAPPASRATEPSINASSGTASQSSAGGESGSDTARQAKETANRAKEKVRQQAQGWAEDAKNRGRQMLDRQKGTAADQLTGIARALHQSADQCMSSEDQRQAGRVIEQAASGLDRLADTLRSRDVDAMIDQATSLMRRQPALFVGGTVVAGFMLSRFLKSSSERSEDYPGRDDEAYVGRERGVAPEPYGTTTDEDTSYVTSAHVNPGEVGNRSSQPPVMPTGRRDY